MNGAVGGASPHGGGRGRLEKTLHGRRAALSPFAACRGLRRGRGGQARRSRRIEAGRGRLWGAYSTSKPVGCVAATDRTGGGGRPHTDLHRLVRGLGGAPPSANGVEAEPAAGIPIGDNAPEFELPRLHGDTLTLGSLRASGK